MEYTRSPLNELIIVDYLIFLPKIDHREPSAFRVLKSRQNTCDHKFKFNSTLCLPTEGGVNA